MQNKANFLLENKTVLFSFIEGLNYVEKAFRKTNLHKKTLYVQGGNVRVQAKYLKGGFGVLVFPLAD